MAIISNVNRRASAKAIKQQVATLKTIAGLAIQTHRAYESPSRDGQGLRQTDVANNAGNGAWQATISNLENGKTIPGDPVLRKILAASGFDLSANKGGAALLAILQAIRDNEANLAKMVNEKPA
jgi:hypothetical protein